jgi:hypothetical protein
MRDAPGARCARRPSDPDARGLLLPGRIGGAGTWIGCALCTAAITRWRSRNVLGTREPPRQPGRAECDRGRHGQPTPWQGSGGRAYPYAASAPNRRGGTLNAFSRRDSRSADGSSSHPRVRPTQPGGQALSRSRHVLQAEQNSVCASTVCRTTAPRDLARPRHQILAFPARHAQLLELRRFGPGCFAASCVTAHLPVLFPSGTPHAVDRQLTAWSPTAGGPVETRSNRSDGARQNVGGLRVAHLS